MRNRDRFVVTATHQDGAMTVRAIDGDGEVVLPAGYVASHVELGYAGIASVQAVRPAMGHLLRAHSRRRWGKELGDEHLS